MVMALKFSKDATMSLDITDYRKMMVTVRKIEPTLIKQMRSDIRDIASPIRDDIKSAIPSTRPLSGMVTKVGRLSWTKTMNTARPLKSVTIESFRKINTKYTMYSLARLRVWSAAVVMADMAGRSGTWVNKRAVTREYDYTYHKDGAEIIGKRKHRINGQGVALINRLNGFGKSASRFVWPAAERSLPHAKLEIRRSLERAYGMLNLEMLRKGK
jgi:hypothetical protein